MQQQLQWCVYVNEIGGRESERNATQREGSCSCRCYQRVSGVSMLGNRAQHRAGQSVCWRRVKWIICQTELTKEKESVAASPSVCFSLSGLFGGASSPFFFCWRWCFLGGAQHTPQNCAVCPSTGTLALFILLKCGENRKTYNTKPNRVEQDKTAAKHGEKESTV